MNGITVQVPLSSYFDAHFKNKYSYDKDILGLSVYTPLCSVDSPLSKLNVLSLC